MSTIGLGASANSAPYRLPLQVRDMGLRDYESVWRDMQAFTTARQRDDRDQLWLVQHPPVFTLGLNGKLDNVLDAGDIAVIRVDRGGQVTYHGPGQIVVYLLLDLNRRHLGVRQLVNHIEQSVIDVLRSYGICANARRDAPGVYVGGAKIAALGLRVRRGCCYHGLALNVDMDLGPFARINPCGYADMPVTQLSDLGGPTELARVGADLVDSIGAQLDYAPEDKI